MYDKCFSYLRNSILQKLFNDTDKENKIEDNYDYFSELTTDEKVIIEKYIQDIDSQIYKNHKATILIPTEYEYSNLPRHEHWRIYHWYILQEIFKSKYKKVKFERLNANLESVEDKINSCKSEFGVLIMNMIEPLNIAYYKYEISR